MTLVPVQRIFGRRKKHGCLKLRTEGGRVGKCLTAAAVAHAAVGAEAAQELARAAEPALAAGLLAPAALPGAPVPAQLEPRAERLAVPVAPPLGVLRVARDGAPEHGHLEGLPARAGPVAGRHVAAREHERHGVRSVQVPAGDGLDTRRLGRPGLGRRGVGVRVAEGAVGEEEEVVDGGDGEEQADVRRDGHVVVHSRAAVARGRGVRVGERDGQVRVVDMRDGVAVFAELQDGPAAAVAGNGQARVPAVRLAVPARDRPGVVGEVERVDDVHAAAGVRPPPARGGRVGVILAARCDGHCEEDEEEQRRAASVAAARGRHGSWQGGNPFLLGSVQLSDFWRAVWLGDGRLAGFVFKQAIF
jgi:hypothetical protein